MAFTGAAASGTRLLVVTDAGYNAVHVIDVVHGAQVGYVAAPGSIAGPRGVAAKDSKVAVSTNSAGAAIRVYEGSGATWAGGDRHGGWWLFEPLLCHGWVFCALSTHGFGRSG
jgi:hypothetical protein